MEHSLGYRQLFWDVQYLQCKYDLYCSVLVYHFSSRTKHVSLFSSSKILHPVEMMYLYVYTVCVCVVTLCRLEHGYMCQQTHSLLQLFTALHNDIHPVTVVKVLHNHVHLYKLTVAVFCSNKQGTLQKHSHGLINTHIYCSYKNALKPIAVVADYRSHTM